MNNRHQARNANFFNPFENIMNEMMNAPIKRFVNQKDNQYTYPATNVEEKEDKFVLHVMLPGLSKKDIDINIEKDHLTISSKTIEMENTESPSVYKLKEYDYHKFERKFLLPKSVLTNEIKANLSKGILKVVIPKNPLAKRTINVL